MLKIDDSVKIERQAVESLRGLLDQVPVIERLDVSRQPKGGDVDIVARATVMGVCYVLICEVKSSGQPRHARIALLQLRNEVTRHEGPVFPIFIAPYLSPEVQTLCRGQGAGFLDFEGNARMVFGGVFIERQVAGKPVVERRELRSLFKPKSAQVLRALLRDPGRSWRIVELAQVADVSVGHVSNVRTALLNREWAGLADEGLFLADPDSLLDAWRVGYEPPSGQHVGFYTTLHGAAFERALKSLREEEPSSAHVALASFSAAQWLAPYGRTGTQHFYADEAGMKRLISALKLTPSPQGENVAITVLENPDLLRDSVEPAPGIVCTPPVQTYLDLYASGERGQESADHLRRALLTWRK